MKFNFRSLFVLLAFAASYGAAGQLTSGSITITGNQIICSGTTHGLLTVASATGGSGNYTYQWQSSSDNSTYNNIGGATGLSYSPGGNITADIYYKVSVNDGSSTALSAAFLVEIHDSPTITISGTPGLTVPPNASVSLSAVLSNVPVGYNYTYLWNNSSTSNPTTVVPSATSTYTITATDQFTCQTSASSTVTVNAFTGGTISVGGSTSGGLFCTGNAPGAMASDVAAAGGSGSGITYQWQSSTTSNSQGFSNIAGATSATLTYSSSITQTVYVRRVATNMGVDVYSNVLTASVVSLPTVSVTASPATIVSGGSSVLSANGASTYAWSPAAGLGGGTTGQSVTATITAQTTYTVTGTDANGCTNTGTVTVNISALNAGSLTGNEPGVPLPVVHGQRATCDKAWARPLAPPRA
jgi:hypothetical protein